MSQNIEVKLVNENNKVIKDFDFNLSELIHRLHALEKIKQFKIIASIDEYGNTLFNQRQCIFASEELNEIKKQIADSDFKDVDHFLEVLSKVNEHEYLLFIGD